MTVSELITELAKLPPDACVNFYDNDYETGGLWFTMTRLDVEVDEDNRNVYIKP